MRKTILCWSLGILSVTWLTGCGIFQNEGTACPLCGASADAPARNRVAATPKKATLVAAVGKKKTTAPTSAPKVLPDAMASTPIVTVGDTDTLEILPSIPVLPMPTGEKVNVPNAIDVVPTTEAKFLPTESVPTKAQEQAILVKNVHIHYGHTANYESVTGQVQSWRKTWRLRYAAVDQEDKYGGSVVLEGGAELSKLRDGQHVRVRGVLSTSSDRTGSPIYRVQAIEILD